VLTGADNSNGSFSSDGLSLSLSLSYSLPSPGRSRYVKHRQNSLYDDRNIFERQYDDGDDDGDDDDDLLNLGGDYD